MNAQVVYTVEELAICQAAYSGMMELAQCHLYFCPLGAIRSFRRTGRDLGGLLVLRSRLRR